MKEINTIKLHLGCGSKNIRGYTNIDIRYLPGVDVVDNVKFLKSFKSNTIDEIYACHVLEHFTRWEYISVLTRWYELLRPGGKLKIAVPDFEKIVEIYQKTKSLKPVMGLLYGGQDYEENFHNVIWDFNSIKEDLEYIGFKNVVKYDWRQTCHSNVDDYSQSYFPHMDKNNGLLVSLNVEAHKHVL